MKWPRTRICSNTAGDLFMLWKRFISLLLSTLSLAQCISMSTAGRSLDPPLEASRTKILLKPQYVDEEDLVSVIKGFSTVTKEHTTFTDTHL